VNLNGSGATSDLAMTVRQVTMATLSFQTAESRSVHANLLQGATLTASPSWVGSVFVTRLQQRGSTALINLRD